MSEIKLIHYSPDITVEETIQWSWTSVNEFCAKYGWIPFYEMEEYFSMLRSIESLEPTAVNIYRIAKQIASYTYRSFGVDQVAAHLRSEAVTSIYREREK